jgi:hypothetical protein
MRVGRNESDRPGPTSQSLFNVAVESIPLIQPAVAPTSPEDFRDPDLLIRYGVHRTETSHAQSVEPDAVMSPTILDVGLWPWTERILEQF